MYTGIQFKTIWQDNDAKEIRVSAWNGAFGGTADVYIGIRKLEEIAAKLAGFPTQPSDVREVMLGAFSPKSAGGGVSMRFYCADHSGHAWVESKIQSDHDSAGVVQCVILRLPIEAAAMDLFVDELRRLDTDTAMVANLKGTV